MTDGQTDTYTIGKTALHICSAVIKLREVSAEVTSTALVRIIQDDVSCLLITILILPETEQECIVHTSLLSFLICCFITIDLSL